jgi:hypothetical protein
MLKTIASAQVHHIAQLAKAAREARDSLLHGAPDEVVDGPHPTKGELGSMGRRHGFDVLPADNPALKALHDTIANLGPVGRSEIFAVMRIGQTNLAAGDWQRLVTEAETLGDDIVFGMLVDNIDLRMHLEKGLYELGST